MEKVKEENQKPSRSKTIGVFVLKTLFYFAVMLFLIYLYEYYGLGSAGFIYNEF